jgi:arginyl-tRNA synthetase
MEQELKDHLIEHFGRRNAEDIARIERCAILNISPYPDESELSTYFLTPVAIAYYGVKNDLNGKKLLEPLKKGLQNEPHWSYLIDAWILDPLKPGYIHFKFRKEFWHDIIKEVSEKGDNYGKDKLFSDRVQFEFVSANPTGPLNVVNARAAAVGDALARAFSALGYDVTREYYVNDQGRQIKLLGESVWAAQKRLVGEEALPPEDGYCGEYITELARQLLKESKTNVGKKAVEQMLAWQKRALAKYGVSFDSWYRQSELEEQGYLGKTRQALNDAGCIYEKDGAVWLQTTKFGDSADQVLVKSDGETTYYLADVAYHMRKHKKGYQLVIDILGPDHHGHKARMEAAMRALGYGSNWLEILIAQQVNIVRGGERVKMGKRVGEFITLEELVDEVGVDVAKYFFLERGLSSHMDFDFELAKKTSMENPVYYIQYAHARICSILHEGETLGLYPNHNTGIDYEYNDEEIMAVKWLFIYPKELGVMCGSRQPQIICSYLHNLAGIFHKYYTKYRILQAETEGAIQGRLNLVNAVRQVIANGLYLLGISAPEKM